MNGKYEIGMIGLGVMGRNLVLNMADHGFSVAGMDNASSQVEALQTEAGGRPVLAVAKPEELVAALRSPRAVMMLVPAGRVVDAVIGELTPLLQPGDLILDCGNSFYQDTDRREKELADGSILFMGVGISGGESGARHGPSIMPGGKPEAYERVRPVLEAAAAHVNGDPCVAYLGPGAAGHYVKMVHNGIEYAVMQLIAEAYDMMRRGLGMSAAEMHAVFGDWNEGASASYLVEITTDILARTDDDTGNPLIDMIRDEARQLGTGMWTSQDAMDLGVPVPTIDIAVAMRNLSALAEERREASALLGRDGPTFGGDPKELRAWLKEAFFAAAIVAYAQGMAQLKSASAAYGYGLDLEAIARIWRGGCIVRAALLEDIRQAYRSRPDLPNILLDPGIGARVSDRLESLKSVAVTAAGIDIPVPALMASLAYFESYRSGRLPANLLQAQRDYFGAHRYERTDREGSFHTEWT